MTDAIRHLLRDIFNQDFSSPFDTAGFHQAFFSRTLTIADLQKVHCLVAEQQVTLGGKSVPAAVLIEGKNKTAAPFAILAQLHGNEPAGLAGILLAMALAANGKLERSVIGVIGNALAGGQYFEALEKSPGAAQETRDAYRCGLGPNGELLPDLNRIPIDFMSRPPADYHTKRAQELYTLGHHISGIADIHSARGNMTCITDYKREADLKNSPIRAVLTELAEAISANASATVTVQTFKTILGPLLNIECQTGIEAGRHESPDVPEVAASFTLSNLYTLGITSVAPLFTEENTVFDRYSVQPRITYADLVQEGTLQPDDVIYMAKQTADGQIVEHQYDEMEAIHKGQVVAVARPSGTLFKAPYDFSTLFISKSAALYDKDPAVGPWPVAADKAVTTKFCYPCNRSKWTIAF